MVYFLSLIFPLSVLLGVFADKDLIFAPVIIFTVIVPLLDALTARLQWGYWSKTSARVADSVLGLWAVLFPAAVLSGGWYVSQHGLFNLYGIGLALSVGFTGSVAIVAGHDLIHSSSPKKRFLGYGILLNVFYMHFGILHRIGHHRHVATPRDHSTAWRGESVYRYILRTMVFGYIDCWKLEFKRLAKKGQRKLGLHNRILLFAVLQLAALLFCSLAFGIESGIFFLLESLVAVTILEVVSYLQHYGILRNLDSQGKFEILRAYHSWESNKIASCVLFLNIPLHSSHHDDARSRFSELTPNSEAMQLPFSYPVMIQLSFVPYAWRRVMHPILDDRFKDAS